MTRTACNALAAILLGLASLVVACRSSDPLTSASGAARESPKVQAEAPEGSGPPVQLVESLLPATDEPLGELANQGSGSAAVLLALDDSSDPTAPPILCGPIGAATSDGSATMHAAVSPTSLPVLGEKPAPLEPWWHKQAVGQLRAESQPQPVGVEQLVVAALQHSPKVRAISQTPLIRETAIMESEAAFDWRTFMESRFIDTNEPVGSTLTTGGPSRQKDRNWNYTAGLRRKTHSGARLEMSQRIGYEDSNSIFFSPTQQGNAKLALSFTQPLLNGAGRAYNESLILLAETDANIAEAELSELLQNHLLEVTRAYWELYRTRGVLLQKRRLHEQAREILEYLESRQEIDALQSQIVRARAAVAARTAEIVRSETAIRNTESRLRVLVNDPAWSPNGRFELIPLQAPSWQEIPVRLEDSLTIALENRPEIEQAAGSVHAASIRMGISCNELLPVLDLITSAYASGLEGESNIGKAYGNQFSEGRPSYTVGLVLEIPLGNCAAKARHLRNRLEFEQLTYQLQQTTETVRSEVEVAVREVDTAFREMQSKHRSMVATETEVQYLTQRWRLLPGEDQAASFLLEDLLEAQERLANEQFGLVTAQVAYTLSLSELKRATGTLLSAEQLHQ